MHFVEGLSSQLKHILGMADQHAHASTFECVQLCSEGKIPIIFVRVQFHLIVRLIWLRLIWIQFDWVQLTMPGQVFCYIVGVKPKRKKNYPHVKVTSV